MGEELMRFSGKITKDGKFWLANIPVIDAMTQGHTEKEAYEMAADLVETFINDESFKATVHPGPDGTFEVSGSDPLKMKVLAEKRGVQ
jgi:predicted RNase H-like HicB family nuclease